MQALYDALETFVTISLRKINEDDLNEQDDYGVTFSEQLCTHGSFYIFLFKCKSFDQSDPSHSRMASNFTHLLSCGLTINNNFGLRLIIHPTKD